MVSTDIPMPRQAKPSRAERVEHTRQVRSKLRRGKYPDTAAITPHHTTPRRGSGTDVTHGLLVLELSSSPAGRVRWRVPLASGVDMVQCTRVRMRSDGDGDGTGLLQEREMESE
jgi:hypothetical protein